MLLSEHILFYYTRAFYTSQKTSLQLFYAISNVHLIIRIKQTYIIYLKYQLKPHARTHVYVEYNITE